MIARPLWLHRDDKLVGVRNVQVPAQELADQVRIGMAGIEKFHPVAHSVPLCRKTRYLGLALLKQPCLFAPGDQPAWTSNTDRSECENAHQRKGLKQAFSGTENGAARGHAALESQLTDRIKIYPRYPHTYASPAAPCRNRT